jgi:uncharacterized protein YciI
VPLQHDYTGRRSRVAGRYGLPVADYYLVIEARGSGWNPSKRRREQIGWDEHAAFMDGLVDEGVVVLGGPIGEDDGDEVLLVADAESEEALRARLAEDPWADDILTIESVRPWSVWLRGRALLSSG